MTPIFITGLYRSGTTLLDKLINSSEEAFVASQPLPFLFFETAQKYLDVHQKSYYPPLNTLFGTQHENLTEFTNWLESYKLSKNCIDQIIEKSQRYSGGLTDNICTLKEKLTTGNLLEVYTKALKSISSQSTSHQLIGAKEVVCEQFIPYFIKNNIKVILIYRDPRDVIASLNYGEGQKHMGETRPTLFNLRQWRKSIAFVLHYQNHPLVHTVKYENLVQNPENELSLLSQFLDIEIDSHQSIKDQNGNFYFLSSLSRLSVFT